MATNLALFLVAELCGGSLSFVVLKRMGAGFSSTALGTEPWRLLSAGYLHMGWRHLLINFTSLLLCGMYLEGLLGPWRLLLLHTLAILASNALLMSFFPSLLVVGASGGICGLLGALLVLCCRPGSRVWWWPPRYRLAPAACCLAIVASTVYGACECGQQGANVAHLSGGLVGAALALSGALTWELMPPAFRELRLVRRSARVVLGGTLACIAFGIGVGRPWELREVQPLVRVQVPGTPISVAVPSGAAAHSWFERSQEDDSWVSVDLGEMMTEPVVVEVMAEKQEEAVPEERLEEMTQKLREELDAEVLGPQEEYETRWMWPMIDRLYTRPAVYSSSYWYNAYWVQRWVMYRGEWRITLRTVRAPGMPSNWEGVEADIAMSLVVEEPGAPRWDTCGAWNTTWDGVCPRAPW
jgi:membrane associated rhomboid family serine protease